MPASVAQPHGSPAFPPAPLDRGEVATALRPFGESRMLPPAAYTSAEVFAWERRHFFGGGWTCAGHASRLPAAGDQLAVETGAGGAVIVRGEDGVIRAFANTCRHRGHELLPCANDATGRAAARPGPGEREGHHLPVPLVGVLAERANCAAPRGTAA